MSTLVVALMKMNKIGELGSTLGQIDEVVLQMIHSMQIH